MISSLVLMVRDSETDTQMELSSVLTNVSWETSIFDQPGKLSFTVAETEAPMFYEGSHVVLEVNAQEIFNGYVFERNRGNGDEMEVVAYDSLRYLNNKDTFQFENHSVNEIFTTVCQAQELPFQIISGSDWKTSPIIHENKSLYEMIIRGIDETLINTGQYLMVRSVGGVIQLVNIADLVTDVFVGDSSLMLSFDFKSSINEDTYNYIKLIQENEENKTRFKYVALDSENIRKWGRLQYFEKIDEEMNESQIQLRTEQLLKLYNRKTRTLKFPECIGNLKVHAGSGIIIGIEKLQNEGIPQMQHVFVSQAKHEFANETHFMDLTVEVV